MFGNRVSNVGKPRKFYFLDILIFLAIFLSFFPIIRISSSVNFQLSDGIFLILLLVIILSRRKVVIPRVYKTPYFFYAYGLLFMILGLGLSSLIHGDGMRGLVVISQYLFTFLFVPVLVFHFDNSRSPALISAYVYSLIIMTLLGLYGFYFSSNLFGFRSIGAGRTGFFLGNPNDYSKTVAICIPFIIYGLRIKIFRKFQSIVMIIVLFFGFVTASSFGGILSLASGLFVMLLLNKFSLRMFKYMIAIMVLIIVVTQFIPIPDVFIIRVLDAVGSNANQIGTIGYRSELLSMAWEEIISKNSLLLGLGADEFSLIAGTPSHNFLLQIWVEGGLLSLIGWLIMYLALAFVGLVSLKRGSSSSSSFGITYVVILTIFFVNILSVSHIYNRFWFLPVAIALKLLAREPVNYGIEISKKDKGSCV